MCVGKEDLHTAFCSLLYLTLTTLTNAKLPTVIVGGEGRWERERSREEVRHVLSPPHLARSAPRRVKERQ